MTATLTIKEVEVIQAALYCLLDHPEYIKGLPREEVEKLVNPIDVKLENATQHHLIGEQLQLII